MAELSFAQREGGQLQNILEKMSILGRFNSAHYNRLLIASHELRGDLEKAVQDYLHFYNDVLLAAYGMPEHVYFFREASLMNYKVAQIHERLGNEGKAIEHYAQFLALWKNADPGLSEAADAKTRLVGLKSR